MRNYAFGAFLLVIVAAICFIVFVVFNYALYNPDSGVDTILNEKAAELMNERNLAKWNNTRANISTGFGMMGVICLFLAIILFVLSALKTRRAGRRY
jgi:Na+/H+ antiporter NhaC